MTHLKNVLWICALCAALVFAAGCEKKAEEDAPKATPEANQPAPEAAAENTPAEQGAAAENTPAADETAPTAENAPAVDSEQAALSTVSVADLAAMIEASKGRAVDANNANTRESQGVIPNAILLTSSGEFDTAKELGEDKAQALVFYCANTTCQASHHAARRAAEAGYTNVHVLPDGIKGWIDAGQKTTPLTEAAQPM